MLFIRKIFINIILDLIYFYKKQLYKTEILKFWKLIILI